jgi:integrase
MLREIEKPAQAHNLKVVGSNPAPATNLDGPDLLNNPTNPGFLTPNTLTPLPNVSSFQSVSKSCIPFCQTAPNRTMPRKPITPVPITKRGIEQWYVTMPKELNSGKARRLFFRTEAGALEKASELEQVRASAGKRFLALPQPKQIAILQAMQVMGERVIELPDAARAYIAAARRETKTILEASAACVESRRQMDVRASSLGALKSTLDRFSVEFGARDISELTVAEVEGWLNGLRVAKGKARAGQPIAKPTRRTYLTDLRTLFAFAQSRGFCSKNPARAIERPSNDDMPRGILTVPQVKQLLAWLRANDPGMLPCICLTLFAGIRPDEARWLSAADFKGKELVIGGEFAKGRARRVVEINPTLRAWLKLGGELPPLEKNFKERIEEIHKAVKPWPHDCLRHSFVSYRCAVAGIKTTAQEAAHSEDTLLRHYRALVTTEEARKFWELRP